MLFYDGSLQEVSGTGAFLTPAEQAAFDRRARAAGLPYRREGNKLSFKLKSIR